MFAVVDLHHREPASRCFRFDPLCSAWRHVTVQKINSVHHSMQIRNKILIGFAAFLLISYLAITTRIPSPPTATPCTNDWFNYIESNYFSTERGDIWSDPVRLDWSVEGDWRWFEYIEKKAGAAPASSGISRQRRCEMLQSHLASHLYIINDSIGLVISLPWRR